MEVDKLLKKNNGREWRGWARKRAAMVWLPYYRKLISFRFDYLDDGIVEQLSGNISFDERITSLIHLMISSSGGIELGDFFNV